MAKSQQKRSKAQKIRLIIIIIVAILLAIAVLCIFFFARDNGPAFNGERVDFPEPIYSVMTGEEISNAELNSSPTYCVQIPNGTDGARPQVGLTEAAVVFEAIAEAGITRFAAIFQNPDTSVIGPIRSLRPYYLDWDIPFDCTVVHAGGSYEAILALKETGARNLNESADYMWREYGTNRSYNNLFTSPTDLQEWNKANDWNISRPTGFSRINPDIVTELLRERAACAEDANCTPETLVTDITLEFGRMPAYNTKYQYDAKTNTYLRSYTNGSQHLVYNCPAELNQPVTTTECGEPVQVAPSVVIAMIVEEGRMSDGYHEEIQTIDSGTAYIFQNGLAIQGTWTKSSQDAQIIFRDSNGEEIALTPGQVWIAAVPQYGDVSY